MNDSWQLTNEFSIQLKVRVDAIVHFNKMSTGDNVAILVNVDLEPSASVQPPTGQNPVKNNPITARPGDDNEDLIQVLADPLFPRTYQNQTAEDIESGRARMDSVTSYG